MNWACVKMHAIESGRMHQALDYVCENACYWEWKDASGLGLCGESWKQYDFSTAEELYMFV